MSEYLDYTGLQEYDSQIKSYIAAQGGGGGSVTGVKGNDESTYRTGNVNISYSDLGVCPITSGGTGAVNVNPNRVFAGPTANAGNPLWRKLVTADVSGLTCKQIFSGTAATSVDLTEPSTNFSLIVVEISLNSSANRFTLVNARPNGYTQWIAPILSSSVWYLKGGYVRVYTSSGVGKATLGEMRNFGVSSSTTLQNGLQTESGCKINRVWGLI